MAQKYLPQLIRLAELAKAKDDEEKAKDWRQIRNDPNFAERDAEIRRIIAEAESKL